MDGRPSWFFLDSVQRRNILPLMRGASGVSTPPARVHERAIACGNDGGRDEVPYSSSVTPPARLLFPAGVTAAHRSLEPFDEVRILGGEPHQSHSGTPNPSSVSE